MFRKILVGYDDSDQSRDALALGKQIADATGAELVVGGVFYFDPVWSSVDPEFSEPEKDYARKLEETAAAVGAKPEAVPSKSPARGLHELAGEIGADLILVGSAHHGRVGQTLAGSVGVALLHGSACAVGVAPRDYRTRSDEGISEVAVGTDGSAEAGMALRAASELAAAAGARLRIVAAAEPAATGAGRASVGRHELMEAIENDTREHLAEAQGAVPEEVDAGAKFVSGNPVDALLEVAASWGTILFVGSRGYGPLRRVLLGSVSTHLVRSAPCPLIVMPRGMHEADEPAATGAEAQSA